MSPSARIVDLTPDPVMANEGYPPSGEPRGLTAPPADERLLSEIHRLRELLRRMCNSFAAVAGNYQASSHPAMMDSLAALAAGALSGDRAAAAQHDHACTLRVGMMDYLIEAAAVHGIRSHADRESADLSVLLRTMWPLLTRSQQRAYLASSDVARVVKETGVAAELVTASSFERNVSQGEWLTVCHAFGIDASAPYLLTTKAEFVNAHRFGCELDGLVCAEPGEGSWIAPERPRG